MRVLQIGQLPTEMGGNYTTGVARVVGELSKHKFGSDETFLYATNISNEKAQALCTYNNQYMGYVKRPFHMLFHMLLHPLSTWKAYKIYRITDNASFIHMEFIRDNFVRIIKLVKPDVIHHHGASLSAMHFANAKTHIPVVYSPHGMVWVDNESDYQKPIVKATQLTLSFADHYTALNESVVKRLQLLGIEKENISVVPNGVDSTKFYFSESARKELRQSMEASDNTLVFITVGLVIDRKGQFDFLKILQSLDVDYQYWIIGKGPDFEKIEQYIKDEQIENRVKLLGYVQDKEIYKYHSAADFYAHASTIEAQALSEIEAYSCGLRIIVNKMVSDTVIGDVNTDKLNYYVADFNNIGKDDFVAWLRKESEKRKSKKQFDWQVVANMYAEVYAKMIK